MLPIAILTILLIRLHNFVLKASFVSVQESATMLNLRYTAQGRVILTEYKENTDLQHIRSDCISFSAHFLRDDNSIRCRVTMWYMATYPTPADLCYCWLSASPLRIEPLFQHTMCMLTPGNDPPGKEAHKPVASQVPMNPDGRLGNMVRAMGIHHDK